MARITIIAAAAVLGLTRSAFAAYDEFFFANENSDWKCPKMGFDCVAPNVCAHDGLLNIYYCCGVGSTDAICWTGSVNCGNGQGDPSGGQISCSSGENAFCCLDQKQTCTQRFNQINICWATQANPIANISADRLNETFSSSSSAHPKQSSYTIDTAALLATSTPASNSASASASATAESAQSRASSATSSTSTGSSNNDTSSSSLSGGAIGGIVVGALAGVGAVAFGVFFLLRRRKNKEHGNELDGNPYAQNGYTGVAQQPPQEKYAHEAPSEAHGQVQNPPVEMPAGYGPSEMEGSKPQAASQLR